MNNSIIDILNKDPKVKQLRKGNISRNGMLPF